MDFVVTAKARTHINATFKKEKKELVRYGINTYEEVVKKLGLPPTSETLNKALLHYGLNNRDDLYVEIGKRMIAPEDLEKALKKRPENKFIKYWNLQFLWNGKDSEGKKKGGQEQGIDLNSDFTIAPCCNPIPGDDVVGMNIAGTKVTVHKRSCPEAIRLMASFGDKIVPVKWVSHKLMSFLAVIKITGIDTPGIVSEVTGLIAKEEKVNMVEKPYIISPEEFGDFDEYTKLSLTYYSDGVLADENDEIVDDIDETVGADFADHFGEYEDDSVFVRNDRLKCDYEILRDNRSYSDVTGRYPGQMED